MTPTSIEFTVYGKAEPAGSKSRGAHGGVFDANPKAKDWKRQVAQTAGYAMADQPGFVNELMRGPLHLSVTIYRKRPANHFGTGRNAGKLKASAPDYPTTKPDTTKLVRGIEDAMTGVVWMDDAQVVSQTAYKKYGVPERAIITVLTIEA